MHVIVGSSAFDVSFLQRFRSDQRQAAQRGAARRKAAAMPAVARMLGVVAQGMVFAAAMWLLLAAPGFLSAQESLVGTGPVAQASR